MTEVRFYHLQTKRLEQALPEIMAKALERQYRVVIKTTGPQRAAQLEEALWTYDAGSFLPHGHVRDGFESQQPIWITDADENPNAATMLVLTDGLASPLMADFPLCCEIFDGNDAAALAAARAHWKDYKAKGYDLSYFQQDENGKWQKKES